MSQYAVRHNFLFSLVLVFLLFFTGFMSSDTWSSTDSSSAHSIDAKISSLRLSLAYKSGREYIKVWKKMAALHKKRLRLDKSDENARWDFIEDDLKYGNGGYAVTLLQDMNTQEAYIKLMEMNIEREGNRVRMKTLNPFKSVYIFVTRKSGYDYEETNIKSLMKKINRDILTDDQKQRLETIEKIFSSSGMPYPEISRSVVTEKTPEYAEKISSPVPEIKETQIPEDSGTPSAPDEIPNTESSEMEMAISEAEAVSENEEERMKKEAAEIAGRLAEEKETDISEDKPSADAEEDKKNEK